MTPDLCFRFHYFALRKMHFLLRAKALVAFPGGFGTLDELFDGPDAGANRKDRSIPIARSAMRSGAEPLILPSWWIRE
ncbi:MAG TPA: LOG family protein [Gemmatimonadaceae bacterium]